MVCCGPLGWRAAVQLQVLGGGPVYMASDGNLITEAYTSNQMPFLSNLTSDTMDVRSINMFRMKPFKYLILPSESHK